MAENQPEGAALLLVKISLLLRHKSWYIRVPGISSHPVSLNIKKNIRKFPNCDWVVTTIC